MENRMTAWGGAALAALLVFSSTTAAELDPRQLKRDLKQADKSWKSGRIEAAAELYEGVLAATAPAAPERANALYAMLMVSLSPQSARHDPERARAYVDELAGSFPSHPHRLEIQALEGLLAANSTLAEKAARLGQQLDDERAACASERQEMSRAAESLAAELAALRDQIATSDKQLTARTAELMATRKKLAEKEEELARKEEALEELTKRVVGRAEDDGS